jgi:glycosyltransferase involved in cell wall biosynthesis
MKIMLNITCFSSKEPTGIEIFAQNIAREICKIEPAATVLSSEQISGVPNACISNLLSFAGTLTRDYEYIFRALWDQTFFRYIVARQKPDVLFFPIQDGLIYPPVKQIITVHDLHYLHFDKSIHECRHEINSIRTKLYKYKMPHILERSAVVVAVSESTKQDIIASFGTNADKIHVIYNGYDDLRFRVIDYPQPTLDQYGLKSGKYFLFVGSILKHKNIARLVQAFALTESEVILVIAGVCKDVDCLQDVKKVAADLGVSDARLRYLEYVPDDDLPYLYNGSLAFVLPSLHEGFGVPIIEAMACGTPVITSNRSAMPEVAGEAALLVDPYSVDSIATAMREVLENSGLVNRLRTAGLERAKTFRWSYSAQKLYDLCKMVTKA